MNFCYAVTQSKTHAFLLQRRMQASGIPCDLAFIPRPIAIGVCNMGVKFLEQYWRAAMEVINKAGLPGCRIFRETIGAYSSEYHEIMNQ